MRKYIYLAGPIAGCTDNEANDWRDEFSLRLRKMFGGKVAGISPLRCEPPNVSGRYELNYEDVLFGTARAISTKNLYDVKACDMMLAYMPRELNERRPSYGTIVELGWAYAFGKPVIVVTDDPYLRQHPVVGLCVGWFLKTFGEAFELIDGIMGNYVR